MTMIRRNLLLASLFVLAGCAAPPPPPAVLTLTIIGGADQNPDPAGHATPVAVRLYQLSATGKFLATDAYTLMGSEARAVGAQEAAASEQFIIAPKQTETVTRALKPGVQFIGIAVLFRRINHAAWRLTAPVKPSGPSALILRLNGDTAKLTAGS